METFWYETKETKIVASDASFNAFFVPTRNTKSKMRAEKQTKEDVIIEGERDREPRPVVDVIKLLLDGQWL